MIYIVEQGDSLYSIGSRLRVSPEWLALQNGLSDPEELVEGQALLVLVPQTVHQALPGQTLETVAAGYGIDVRQLLQFNPWLAGRSALSAGENIVISYREAPRSSLTVLGYTYTFTDRQQLLEVLPALSAVLPFTYGFDGQGQLLPIEDSDIVAQAAGLGTAALLVLAPLNAEGGFSNELIGSVLNDEAAVARLISQVREQVLLRGYAGVDLDFEYVRAEDADAYVSFVQRLAAVMHENGRIVSIALAPKYNSEQQGLLYEGQDYRRLGEAADLTTLMTYEWGYSYGPPLAVAPLYEIRRVVDYALTEIPAEKILLGISNYGYDWTLPYEEGTAARSLSTPEALELAYRYGSVIRFDEISEAPWFEYVTEEGERHQVWFEDVRSLQAKLDLVTERGLRGITFWNLNRPFPAGFLLTGSLYPPSPLPAPVPVVTGAEALPVLRWNSARW